MAIWKLSRDGPLYWRPSVEVVDYLGAVYYIVRNTTQGCDCEALVFMPFGTRVLHTC